MGLECPEPLANLYSRSYFRATWVMTALDAGFWTAMPIRKEWLRDIASIIFTIYYLFAAEQADEKARRVRATVTVEHLRVSLEKSRTPYLKFLTTLLHPFRTRYEPRHLKVQRPKESEEKEPVDVWVYFEGSHEELKTQGKIVLDIPGGGFVSMSPRNHDDKLMGWSKKLKLPIISVEYKKAPEYPYPYALNECYDLYHSIITTKGKCIGLSGDIVPKIAMSGDSAGGNLAAGVTLMILNSTDDDFDERHTGDVSFIALPPPEGLVLIYPSLDLNINSWMTDEQIKLIKERSTRQTNRSVVRRKSDYFAEASGKKLSTHGAREKITAEYDSSDSEYEGGSSSHPGSPSPSDVRHLPVITPHPNTPDLPHQPPHTSTLSSASTVLQATKPPTLSTRLAMTSRLTYFNDRILTPEMMRAMIILYIGPHNKPDFSIDFLLSPIMAPESLLRKFPKTYFLTGERDPLVDDTVIFAGRIRQAKTRWAKERRDMGLLTHNKNERGIVDTIPEVRLIPGSSHGFLLMAGVFPQAKREIVRCARWLEDTLSGKPGARTHLSVDEGEHRPRHHYRTDTGTTSVGMDTTDDEGDLPLEMAMSSTSSVAVKNLDVEKTGSKAVPRIRGRGRRGSHVLGSEEDLVGRRMQGLMGGLTGLEDRGG